MHSEVFLGSGDAGRKEVMLGVLKEIKGESEYIEGQIREKLKKMEEKIIQKEDSKEELKQQKQVVKERIREGKMNEIANRQMPPDNVPSPILNDFQLEIKKDRAMGCVLGAFVGDAAGATLEFIDYKRITDELVARAMKL